MTEEQNLNATLLLVAQLLGEREVVAYRPSLARTLGSPLAALFLCQALYWQRVAGEGSFWFKVRDAKKDEDGNIVAPFNGAEQSWEWELGMSRSEQERARKILKKNGLLTESLRGVPAKLNYKVNLLAVYQLLIESTAAVTTPPPVGRIPPTGGRNITNKKARSSQQEGRISPSITETTHKTTHKTTTTQIEASDAAINHHLQKNDHLSKMLSMPELKSISTMIDDLSNLPEADIQALLNEFENALVTKKIKTSKIGWFNSVVKNKKLGLFTPATGPQNTSKSFEDSQHKELEESLLSHELKMKKNIENLPKGKVENLSLVRSILKQGAC